MEIQPEPNAEDLSDIRELLDQRYDEMKSGKVRLIPGDEVEAYFADKIAEARRG